MTEPASHVSDEVVRKLRLRDLQLFVSVAQSGAMGRAAAELGITQSAVSQVMADLEAAVGTPLLDRGPRGVTVTPCGAALLHRCAEAFDALRQGVRDVAFLSEPGAGEVRIGASESYIAGGLLAATIDLVVKQYPRLEVIVTEANTAERDFKGLRERSLDIVLGRMATGPVEDDLELEVLYDEPILLLVGATSCWTRQRAHGLTLHDLARGPWVLAPPGTAVRILTNEAFIAAGSSPPTANVTTYSMQLRMQLLSQGDYISSLPASLLRQNARRWNLEALPIDLGRQLPVAAVTLRHRTLGPAVSLFLHHLRAVTKDFRTDATPHPPKSTDPTVGRAPARE